MKKIFSILMGLLGLSACSGTDVLNFITPSRGYEIKKDIAYDENTRQKLDIYIPSNLRIPAKVIVFFYGGSWQMGSKDQYKFAAKALSAGKNIVVIPDYRLYPEVHFPEFLKDSAKAVAWVHSNISNYGGDVKNIYLGGHSAGAYNAIMLGINEEYLRAVGGSRTWIKGTFGLAGPYDFLPMTDPKIIEIFSTAKKDIDTQPITFVNDNKVPPILLMHGDADDQVYFKNSVNLAAKLDKFGNKVMLKTYEDVGHIGIILSLARGFRYKSSALEDIKNFINE